METSRLTRRRFAGALGAVLGAALAPLRPAGAAAAPAGPSAGPVSAPAAPGRPGAPPAAGEPAKHGAIRLDSNENPYGPCAAAREAMTRSQAVAARYPDDLEDAMAEAIARLHGVVPDQIVLGCGSGEVLKMADLAFLGPGRTVVVPEPTFEAVAAFAKAVRAEAVKVPLAADFRLDLDAMAVACDARTGLVYVCNPNNPTGTVVGREALRRFVARVPPEIVILVDEAYFHFVEDKDYGSAADLVAADPRVVVARTFSKIYGLAGMRLGYALGARETIARMRPYKIWSNANAAVLEAGLASLRDAGHVERQRAQLNTTRRWLVAELQKDGRRVIPSEANFVMIDVRSDVGPLLDAFHARGIHPGRRFASMPNWLRVTVGTQEETEAFAAALREIVPAGAPHAASRAGAGAGAAPSVAAASARS